MLFYWISFYKVSEPVSKNYCRRLSLVMMQWCWWPFGRFSTPLSTMAIRLLLLTSWRNSNNDWARLFELSTHGIVKENKKGTYMKRVHWRKTLISITNILFITESIKSKPVQCRNNAWKPVFQFFKDCNYGHAIFHFLFSPENIQDRYRAKDHVV